MGGPQGRLLGRALLWRLARLGGARADRRSRHLERLARDAFKPEDGQRSFDSANEFSRKALLAAVEKGEPGRPSPKAEAFHVNEKDRAWVDSKTTPQPNGVALQPIKLTGAREKVAKKTYIRAAKYPQPAFDKTLAEWKADKSWRTFEVTESGHDVMVDAPQWLVDVLLQVS